MLGEATARVAYTNPRYHRDPKDNSREKDTLEYYLWLAKLAEKGKITSIFFADTYAGIKFVDSQFLRPLNI